jgi:hypothetical protein
MPKDQGAARSRFELQGELNFEVLGTLYDVSVECLGESVPVLG